MRSGEFDDVPGIGRWQRFGNGPPVVILSNPQVDPATWAGPHVDALVAAGYSVIPFVHLGARHDYKAVARDVAAFIALLDAGPVRLYGWSQGAAIAQEVCLWAPRLVSAVVLVATYGRQSEFDRVLQDAWDELINTDVELASVRLALQFLTGEPPQRLSDDAYMTGRKAAMRRWTSEPAKREKRRRSRDFIDSYQDRLGALGGISTPSLVIGFELDTDTFVRRAREVAEVIEGSRYVEIAGAGHLLPVTDPDVVIGHVISFLKEMDAEM